MVTPEATQNILQTLVRNELVYQQSLELGLDKDPVYRKKLNEVEAQFRAFQRQEIAVQYREYINSKAAATDSEAKEYFEKNSKKYKQNSIFGKSIIEERRPGSPKTTKS